MVDRAVVDVRFNMTTGKWEVKARTSHWEPLSSESGQCPVCGQFNLNVRGHVAESTDEAHAVFQVMDD